MLTFNKCISIKMRMKKLGITQKFLAGELGMSRSLLSAVLNRKYDSSIHEAKILAKLKDIEEELCSSVQE